MALTIKSIPTLYGKEADRFYRIAKKAEQNRGKTDFTKEAKNALFVLRKAGVIA